MINFFDREYMIRRELCHEAKVACSLSTFDLIFQIFMVVLLESRFLLRGYENLELVEQIFSPAVLQSLEF